MMLFAVPPDPSQPKPRVLIVEDDHSSRQALVQILQLHDYDVISAPTLAQALSQLGKNPTTLLLDLMLPDGNGMDVLRLIRQHNLPIRVAVITGADKPMIAQANSLAPDALFTKPLDLDGLIHWLQAA